MKNMKIHKSSGFTLIEVIAVLVVIGIISVIISTRLVENNTELSGQIEIIKMHLRYAQSNAMSTSSNWYVYFETSPAPGQYTLYKKDVGSKYFPGESDYLMKIKSGLLLSGDKYILFDKLGRPFTDLNGTKQTNLRTIITSAVGDIEIIPETGFIP